MQLHTALGAALSLTKGSDPEVRSLRQPIYGRFSEGFETADLKTAKAYLDSWQ
jgi:hypothetical protein